MAKSIILVATDFSEVSAHALESARGMAEQSECAIHAVHVLAPVASPSSLEPFVVGPSSPPLGEPLAAAFAALEGECRGEGLTPDIQAHVRIGRPDDEIVALAEELGADMILVGTHGRRGIRRLALGSVAEAVVRKAPCTVLVVRPRERPAGPGIAPPCSECVAVRQASGGVETWCGRHAQHHRRAHTYRDDAPPGFTGTSLGIGDRR